jgi:branched-chain amino acid aminotransferase
VTASASHSQVVWLNGSFLPLEAARISPLDRGFLYGDGLFETMRAQKGSLLYLDAHLARLRRSLETLRITFPDLNWKGVLREILSRNELLHEIATVKIITTRGSCAGLGLPSGEHPTVCITAQRYLPPSPELYEKGWRLHVFQEGFSPPLSDKKTLNYLYFLFARQAALDAGREEALILDPRGQVTETSAGSLLAYSRGRWWTPMSSCQLPSITLAAVCKLLRREGEEVERRPCPLEELLCAQTVWILNSLMLVMPVREIDGRVVDAPAPLEASRMRNFLIGQ